MLAWSGGFFRWPRFGGRFRSAGGGAGGGAPSPRPRGRKLALVAATLLLTTATAAFCADALLRPSLHAWASSRAVNVATQAISAAVRDYLSSGREVGAMFSTVTDAGGDVVLIDYDMAAVNEVRADVASLIQRELAGLGEQETQLPLGLLTGIDALAARGPRLPVRIVPIGSVTAVPKSDFRSAGINFVQHRLYIHVIVKMRVIAPYLDTVIPVEQVVVLSNQIVPGKVPTVYVGVEGVDLRQLQDGLLRLQSGAER